MSIERVSQPNKGGVRPSSDDFGREAANEPLSPGTSLDLPVPQDLAGPDFYGTRFFAADAGAAMEKAGGSGSGHGRIDITSYLDILERGVWSPERLALADELFRLVDPEGAGLLADATGAIPHAYVRPLEGTGSKSVLGMTIPTFSQYVDRKKAGAATRMEFVTQ